ncbi:DNA (cytosine-5)-methyltransferase 1 [Paraburkholderia sp. WSM4175]
MTLAARFDLLKQARARFTQREIADHVGKDIKTVRRWEKGETPCPAMLEPALRDLLRQGAREAQHAGDAARFRFIDLFAGIGGIRMGFEAHGDECVFTSEWNEFSTRTYRENYGDNSASGGAHALIGDIVTFPAEDVPSHDVLLGGFPCQPFSIAGVSKKNALGRPHGFECTTQARCFRRRAHHRREAPRRVPARKRKEPAVARQGPHLRRDPANAARRARLRGALPRDRWPAFHASASRAHHHGGLSRQDQVHVGRPAPEAARRVQPKYTLTPKLWAYLQNYAATLWSGATHLRGRRSPTIQ